MNIDAFKEAVSNLDDAINNNSSSIESAIAAVHAELEEIKEHYGCEY